MDLYLSLFIFFSSLILGSGIMVILTVNPVHSILYLVLVFCGSSCLLLMVKAEFLAMMFLMIYIGAIAVLFLFVIMMLNVKVIELNENLIQYLPLSGLISLIFLFEIFFLLKGNNYFETISSISYVNWGDVLNSKSNMEVIGEVVYTYYFILFLVVGLILLVAMIGPIVLTLNKNRFVRRQNLYEQILRNPEVTVNLKDLEK